MKNPVHFIATLWLLSLITMNWGCSSNSPMTLFQLNSEIKSPSNSPASTRLIQHSLNISIEVDALQPAIADIRNIVANEKGRIDSTHTFNTKSARIAVKVPSLHLESTKEKLSNIGIITRETQYSHDVTTESIDIESKLENLKMLRGRFQALLSEAKTVEEMLNIEKELSRIQTDIDTIEGQRKLLIGSVEQATIDIELKQKTLLGPLGHLGKGVIWIISKLFVLR